MQPTTRGTLIQVLSYMLWLVSAAVSVVAVIELRSAVNVIWAALGAGRDTINLVNQLVLLLGSLAAFIYVLFLEGYYREGAQRAALGSEAAGATPIQAPVLPSVGDLRRRNRMRQWLAGTGLPVLIRRFAVTIAVPLGVVALCLALREFAFAYHRW